MKTPTVKKTLFTLTSLTAMLAVGSIAAHAGPPTITLSGHYNSNTTGDGNGYTIKTGNYLVVSPAPPPFPIRPRFYTTTFDDNKMGGLAVNGLVHGIMLPPVKPSVTVSDGQFIRNQDGLFLAAANGTIQNGEFDDNSLSGVEEDAQSTLTITGGDFSSNRQNGLYVNLTSTATVYGGQFTGNEYGVYSGVSSNVIVAGGTFSGNTQDDLWANFGTITLTGNYRGTTATVLTGSGSVDVLFPGSKQWQTLKYKTTNGGEIVLVLRLK